ncbi:hypothetical protein RV16_GL002141 [Enterococcus saccharolyticus]|nr:hypothetical protein RV16_GL002141 [Enterococcus saccharolyticus]
MNNGVIEQYDTPENIYRLPKTKFVAQFIGFENFFDVTKTATGYQTANQITLSSTLSTASAEQAVATIRPEDIQIVQDGAVKGTVVVRTFLGKSHQYEVTTELGTLLVNGSDQQVYQTGEEIQLHFPAEKLVILER